MPDTSHPAPDEWWRGAVIYQIYPRSFRDSDGDGVGDLAGIAGRLDHVAALGADAVWLSPFFPSPMADFGYDVADYTGVDPLFGTMADFDALLARAHELGLRVLLDLVLSHSSAAHPWFEASRADRTNEHADWYVWTDPGPDGDRPNNWLAHFGGPAWTWEPRRRQYYLHNFLAEQPDLNFHHPPVREALLDVARFWLERGVDGFRLDVANLYVHDPALPDNPPSDPRWMEAGEPFAKPIAMQRPVHNTNQPGTLDFLAALRGVLDEYGATTSIAEIISPYDRPRLIADYTAPGRLHMAYSFELLGGEGTAAHIAAAAGGSEAAGGWTNWAVSNHDVPRVASRWSEGEEWRAATLWSALAACLHGSTCVYQGEELGLPQADVPFERIVDPEGREFWPDLKGRDGCRTPFPWGGDAARDGSSGGNAHAGFGTPEGTDTWLPVDQRHEALSVERQRGDPDSPLERLTRFYHWRRGRDELRLGDMAVRATGDVLVVERRRGEARTWIAFNCSGAAASVEAPEGARDLAAGGFEGTGALEGGAARLQPWGALFAAL